MSLISVALRIPMTSRWSTVRSECLSPQSKTFFSGFDRIEAPMEPLYKIQRKKIGYECFLINRLNLASILSEDGSETLERVKRLLPEWTLLVILRGARRRPEGKFAYEEEALKKIVIDSSGMELKTSL